MIRARVMLVGTLLSATAAWAQSPKVIAKLDEVAVGIATSSDGRVFVSFSRAIDPTVKMSVAELKDGKPVAFPQGMKQDDGAPAADRLLSVQALSVDDKNRLWLLDCGVVGTNAVQPGAPKLVAVDLATNKVVKNVPFAKEVAGETSFLNDLRIDVTRGAEGTIYITDAAPKGPNGIVVVDIASGRAQRRLNDHPSTKPTPGLTVNAEGQPLLQKKGPDMGKPFAVGADGIALSPDGKFLYYSPLTGRHLYRVSTDALQNDAKAAQAVEDLGDKGFASDGLLMDAQGRLYATDYERGAIHRRNADGKWEPVASDEKLSWPDTLALLPNGALLVTETQIHKSARFQGFDKRERPFEVTSIPTDSKPKAAKAQGRPSPRP